MGLIPHLKWENEQWVRWSRAIPAMKEVFDEYIARNEQKLKAAQELKTYNMKPFHLRVRKFGFVDQIPKEDWKKIVHTYRNFMIY